MPQSKRRFRPGTLLPLGTAIACALSMPSAGALAKPKADTPLTEIEAAAIRQSCEDISEQYAQYLDGKDYEKLPTVFAPDGVWEVLGKKMEGREQIREYWKSRTAAWTPTHGRLHQISNQVVTVIDRDHATGRSFVTIYMYDTPNAEKQSLAPLLIARNDDEYVRTPEGWRIKRRTITTLAMQDPKH